MVFAEYPELAKVRGIGAKLDVWRENPQLARAYAEEAVREGWPDLGAAEAGGRAAVALPETTIGIVLRKSLKRARGEQVGEPQTLAPVPSMPMPPEEARGDARHDVEAHRGAGGVVAVVGGESREGGESEASEPDWRRFGPAEPDMTKCLGRVWPGKQCGQQPLAGKRVCGTHDGLAAHGLVTGPIPEHKLKELKKNEARRKQAGRRGESVDERAGLAQSADVVEERGAQRVAQQAIGASGSSRAVASGVARRRLVGAGFAAIALGAPTEGADDAAAPVVELSEGERQVRRELEADAAVGRAAAAEQRGIGDVAVARRMATRSARTDALVEEELRHGRGGGGGGQGSRSGGGSGRRGGRE